MARHFYHEKALATLLVASFMTPIFIPFATPHASAHEIDHHAEGYKSEYHHGPKYTWSKKEEHGAHGDHTHTEPSEVSGPEQHQALVAIVRACTYTYKRNSTQFLEKTLFLPATV